jgi:hypothetical protein
MIAALIFAISFLTLLQFFVSYSRSLIAASRGIELSEEAREICGATARRVAGDQFLRLLALIALCPESGGDSFEIRAVALYFRMLDFARTTIHRAIPSATSWIEAERGSCAYAAAVALAWRIAYSRMMMAQLASH